MCCVDLFAVKDIFSGKLNVRPRGPVVAVAGTTVFIDCSSDEQWRPNLWWFQRFVPVAYPPYVRELDANNVTFGPFGEGRIGYQWINETVLRLVISSVEKQDSGTYWCVLDHQERRSVVLDVVDSPRLQLNASG